jgi:hypothetical protein
MITLKSFDGFKPSLQVGVKGLDDIVGSGAMLNFFVSKEFVASLNNIDHYAEEGFIVPSIFVINMA